MSRIISDTIPTAAFIEHFVIEMALKRRCSLQEASKLVHTEFNFTITPHIISKETRILGLMYCLIVFPSEIWKRRNMLDVVVESAKLDPHISVQNKDIISVKMLRSLRNSVAHAKIKFEYDFIFLDVSKINDNTECFIKFNFQEITNLLLVLGRAFHKCAQVQDLLENAGRDRQ